ncbi:MAG: hypothetical protein HQ526_02725, partial [Actinobacteria bacterium]|nr:hypothetical protein [Actinomycetota bacterium]
MTAHAMVGTTYARALTTFIAAVLAMSGMAACSSTDSEPPTQSWAPAPVDRGGLRTLASITGTGTDSRVALSTAHGPATFWSGVNLGATVPGHSPGEVAIPDETYKRWIGQMGDFGVHFLCVYTIHQPGFYRELRDYNLAHPQQPIYLVQGVYLPDESYVDTQDLWATGPTKAFTKELLDASAAVSGDLTRTVVPGRATGTWDTDVSQWLAAWIVGVEWDPVATNASDMKNANKPAFRGKYFGNPAKSPDVSATEKWLAQRMDELATAEAQRGRSMPIAFANWPTTDPLQHPDEPLPSEDLVGVDANNVLATPAWPGGTFASFHAYPYYPDFLRHTAKYQEFSTEAGPDAYAGYLEDMKQHFAQKDLPLMITEFGVPSSIGSAHYGTNGRDQGQHSEQDAMSTDADLIYLLKELGMSGGLLFAWVDEWFKFTWNTVPRQSVVDAERRSLWHDPLTNEQWFGIIAQDPVGSGWRTTYESPTGVQAVAVDTNASFVNLRIRLESSPSQPIRIEFSSAPGQVAGPSEAVVVDPSQNSATAYVRTEIDPIRLDGLNPADLPIPSADGWEVQRMTVNRSFVINGKKLPAEFVEIGKLVEGDWDPNSPNYNSLATWSLNDNQLSLRLPWSMLGIADPSSRTGVVPGPNGQAVAVQVPEIPMTIDIGASPIAVGAITWEPWQQARATERVKA